MQPKREIYIKLWDYWQDKEKFYAVYQLVDMKTQHSELIFCERDAL